MWIFWEIFSQLANIINKLYPLIPPMTLPHLLPKLWRNILTNINHISNLNWRQKIPCHNIDPRIIWISFTPAYFVTVWLFFRIMQPFHELDKVTFIKNVYITLRPYISRCWAANFNPFSCFIFYRRIPIIGSDI